MCAQDKTRTESEPFEGDESGYWNLSLKTMGGKQFWTDYLHFHGYRIQKNCTTGHYRLLDSNDIRRAWGSFEACKKRLSDIAAEKQLKPMTGRVLIIMHGLTRTRSAMKPLAKFIEDNSDINVINVSYASTRNTIRDHALALDSVIRNLPNVTEINFLGHSMGSIVVRYYLGTTGSDHGTKPIDPRYKRMVMLAPPNQGSRLATILQNNLLFKTFWGVSGQELSKTWKETDAKLATPPFEFGIIAGGQADSSTISNTFLKGKDDWVVTVDETKLPGASDFLQRPLIHSVMMHNEEVHRSALSFLENGYFISAAKRQPLSSEPSK